jgi:hypothetical protein
LAWRIGRLVSKLKAGYCGSGSGVTLIMTSSWASESDCEIRVGVWRRVAVVLTDLALLFGVGRIPRGWSFNEPRRNR